MYKKIVSLVTFTWVASTFMVILLTPSILIAWAINDNFFDATKGADYFSISLIYIYFILSTIFICIASPEKRISV